tara:strand:+ start:4538 stop:4963 length:426 start_codon:yes stop_codon:yes gene_type:complete
MDTTAIRKKLHRLIEDAADEKLVALLEAFSAVETGQMPWWKDPETIKEPDDRLKSYVAEQGPTYTLSNMILDKYFGYLKNLDTKAKKSLIQRLTQSLENKSSKAFDLNSLFGAWEDEQSSDEIIAIIKNARVNNTTLESFE